MEFLVIVHTESEIWVHLVGCPRNFSQCQSSGKRNTKYRQTV